MRTIGVTNSLYCHETVAVISRINTPGLIHNLLLENELHMTFIFCCDPVL